MNHLSKLISAIIVAASSTSLAIAEQDKGTSTDDAAVVGAFLETLAADEFDRFMSLWAENAVMTMPFAPEGVPDRFEGLNELRPFWRSVFDQIETIRFEDVRMYEAVTPGTIFTEHEGISILAADGRSYDNTYITVFRIADGQILSYTEYYDPMVLIEAFGSPDDLSRTFDQ